jgi:hypothetical protein
MALWFAIIRIREMMQQSSNASKWMQNRWTTQAQASRRQAVNLDEAFADQWSQTYG